MRVFTIIIIHIGVFTVLYTIFHAKCLVCYT